MAWNNGYPATYGQMYPQGYQMAQQPAFGQQMPNPTAYQAPMTQQQMSPTQMSGTNQSAQMMTPPTIRAEIIQLADETWENTVDRFPLGPGASQMFITKSEDKVIIKTIGQDGPLPLIIYDKRPPEPPAPKFDPAQFMRRDEVDKIIKDKVEMLVSAALAAQHQEKDAGSAQSAPKRAAKKEVE